MTAIKIKFSMDLLRLTEKTSNIKFKMFISIKFGCVWIFTSQVNFKIYEFLKQSGRIVLFWVKLKRWTIYGLHYVWRTVFVQSNGMKDVGTIDPLWSIY